MVDKKYIIGLFIVTVIGMIIYVSLGRQVKIRVDRDKTTLYVYDGRYWRVGGREFNKLYEGTRRLNRRVLSIKTWEESDPKSNDLFLYRYTKYIRGPVIKDTYYFDGNIGSVEMFPIYHTVEIFNATGFYYRYEVKDLVYEGPTFKLDGEQTSQEFGRNIKVNWWEGYRLGWIYKTGSMYVKSEKINSDYVKFNVRIFDPVLGDWIGVDENFQISPDGV